MIWVLEACLCALQQLANAIIAVLVLMVNGMIVGLGAFLGVIVGLLPNMPEAPAKPNSSVLGFLNWLFPLAGVAGIMVTMGSLFLGFLAVRVALNWARAL